jgi:hypothetical protein
MSKDKLLHRVSKTEWERSENDSLTTLSTKWWQILAARRHFGIERLITVLWRDPFRESTGQSNSQIKYRLAAEHRSRVGVP